MIVTLGSRGALLTTPTDAQRIEPVPVKAVDTTGAGDAFVGSFARFFAGGVASGGCLEAGGALRRGFRDPARHAESLRVRRGIQEILRNSGGVSRVAAVHPDCNERAELLSLLHGGGNCAVKGENARCCCRLRSTRRKASSVIAQMRGIADIIEIGTPLLKRFGIGAIATARELCPDTPILADTKTVDAGDLEAEMVFGAGARLMTVLSSTSRATHAAVGRTAARFGALGRRRHHH